MDLLDGVFDAPGEAEEAASTSGTTTTKII